MKQVLINFLYRYPKSAINTYKRFGGYPNYRKIIQGAKKMEKAALSLPPVTSQPDGFPLYFLTGKRYLYQTLFCIQSLVKVSTVNFKFVLVDDGTFDEKLINTARRQLPQAEIIDKALIDQNLAAIIPEHLFPVLHQKRRVYPHIKKLTDIHTLPGKWKLVLDSDMLFWKSPDVIIDWLESPGKPLYMTDCQNSYGYSGALMETLCGSTIPDLVNVGAVGLNSESLHWQNLENWIAKLEENEGTSYYLEQALTAMLIAKTDAVVLPNDQYIVNPDNDTVKEQRGILHHYVDLSKEGYFKEAWKKI